MDLLVENARGYFDLARVPANARELYPLQKADAASLPSTVSGGERSLLPWKGLPSVGKRIVSQATPRDRIRQVTGEQAKDPIRAYASIEHAASPSERAALLVAELERLGAFDRKLLAFVLPIAPGTVPRPLVGGLEYLMGGDVAIGMAQYATRGALGSVHKVPEAAELTREVIRLVNHTFAEREARGLANPEFRLYSVSLGAWSSQDAFLPPRKEQKVNPMRLATEPASELHTDGNMWFGRPGPSKLHKLASRAASREDYSEFDSVDSLRDSGSSVHSVSVALPNDLVPKLNVLRRPDNAAEGERFIPLVTFLSQVRHVPAMAKFHPARYVDGGNSHDYRGLYVDAVSIGLGTGHSQRELAAIREQVKLEELVYGTQGQERRAAAKK